MIYPSQVINKIIEILELNSDKFPNYTFGESSEDTSIKFQPPFGAVYADFDEQAQRSSYGVPYNIPVSIYVIFRSVSYEKSYDALTSVLMAAFDSMNLILGEIQIINSQGIPESVFIKAQPMPLVILEKKSSSSSVQLQLTYNLI